MATARSPYSPSTEIVVGETDHYGILEKNKQATETIRPIDSEDEERGHIQPADPTWQPGIIARFPVLGFGALFVVLLCAVADVLVLVFSNNVSQTKWPKQIAPNVVLSGLNSLSSICFSIAIGELGPSAVAIHAA